jgi:3'-phosphoadenosine 5'-phosphosulfate sulfotransferase (PAPS reductase)/FAD synthetase
VWRPILDWTVEQVIQEHRRAAIPMHPLYHQGAERVGCWPCIHAGKAELEILGRIDPERVARVRQLEATTGGTMFTRDRRTEKKKLLAAGASAEEAGPSVVPIGIDEVIAWARTERGGKQIALVRTPSGCARWGVCERLPEEGA